jgi:hypothetical protein
MSSSFSDKPPPSPPVPEQQPPYLDLPPPHPRRPDPRLHGEPGVRINPRNLLAGFSTLLLVIGALLVCFVDGGLITRGLHHVMDLHRPGHVIGYICMALGAIGFVFWFSLETRDR